MIWFAPKQKRIIVVLNLSIFNFSHWSLDEHENVIIVLI